MPRCTSTGRSPPLPGNRVRLQLSPLASVKASDRYEIWQDLPSKQREEALRQAALNGVEKRYQEELKLYVDVGSMTPEAIQELGKPPRPPGIDIDRLSPEERSRAMRAYLSSPEGSARLRRLYVARTMATPLRQALAKIVGGLTSQQWKTVRSGQALTFSTDPQPGEPRLPAEMEAVFRTTKPTLDRYNVSTTDGRAEERLRQRERTLQEQWAAATGYRVELRFEGIPSRMQGFVFFRAQARPMRTGAPGGTIGFSAGSSTELQIMVSNQDLRELNRENTPERRAALEQDPVVGVKRPFRPEATLLLEPVQDPARYGAPVRQLLPEWARTYDVQFLADAYSSAWRSRYTPTPAGATPTALFEHLDRHVQFSHHWERQGNLIRLRSRTWFLDRPREIPLRLVRSWQEQQRQRGTLTLEKLAGIATSLTEAQLDGLGAAVYDEFAGLEISSVSHARQALRLYGAFSAGQRRQLQHGDALPVAQMTRAQQSLFLSGVHDLYRGQTEPLDLTAWPRGSFSLTSRRGVLSVERIGGSSRNLFEAEDNPDGAPDGAEARSAHGRAAAAVPRYPVLQLEPKLRYVPQKLVGASLTVPDPS